VDLFLQYFANGLVIGSTYVLVAVGLTLIFGILGVVNFAHGEFYMLGAYAGITAASVAGMPLLWAFGVVLVVSLLLGWGAELLLHTALRGRDVTSSIISSFGIAVVLQNASLLIFGPQPLLLKTELSRIGVELGPVYLSLNRVLIPVIVLALVALLYGVLHYTWTGKSLRAMAQHPAVARLCGVRVSRVAVVTFMVAAVLAGISGFLMSAVYTVHPMVGNMIVLKAFTVVILGGMGNILGAAGAGLILGIAESMTSAYLGNSFRDIVGFVIVIAVLLLRPQGLFGRAVERS